MVIETSSSPSNRVPRIRALDGRPRAFTLLEVMVALFVVAIAFVALIGLHGRNVQLIDRANHFNRATLLAREMLTQLQLEAAEGGDISDSSGTFESDPDFHWQRQVSDTSYDTVKRVHLVVYWDEGTPIELLYFVGRTND